MKKRLLWGICSWILTVAMVFGIFSCTQLSACASTSSSVKATINKQSDSGTWAEYNYTVKNGTSRAITDVKIKIPVTGNLSGFQYWGMNAEYSNGVITITHTAQIKAGETFRCTNDAKFGFTGGATLGKPTVTFTYAPKETSSSKLKYSVTGATKNLAKSETPVGMHGALKLKTVSGYNAPIIVDKNGDPYQLRGASTHGIQWSQMAAYVNKKSFQSLRDEWGVNTVRLACYVTQDGYLRGHQAEMDKKIQEGVKAATELGMYVIIDWHIHAENPLDYMTEANKFFKKYATKYKSYDNVIFEICNEPVGVPWYNGSGKDLYTYCKKICKTIRSCGSNALIICGTNTWSQDVDQVAAKPLAKDGIKNVLYSFHFYSGTHYGDLMNKFKTANSAGTPVFVTEFGVCDASGNGNFDTANADAWINLCDSYNISYCCWSLCNKDESASYLKPSCTKTEGGWTASDVATTGIWLINTYRAHEEKESVRSIKLSGKGTIASVKAGYKSAGKATIKITNNGGVTIKDLSAKLSSGKNFTITRKLASAKLAKGKSVTIQISLKAGLGVGTYTDTLTVKTGTVKKTLKITQKVTAVPVTSVKLNKTTAAMKGGGTLTLKATVLPSNATNKNVTWSTSNSAVATVSSAGKVTAKNTGTANITVKTKNGGYTASCVVTVTNPLSDFSFAKDAAKITMGDTKALTITTKPANPDPYKIQWESDNPEVLSIDANGTMTANAYGTANIKVVANGIEKTVAITVVHPLEGIQLNKDSISIEEEAKDTITVTPLPEDAILGDVKFSSSDSGIAKVDSKGNVTAVQYGTTTITVKCGNFEQTCNVNVAYLTFKNTNNSIGDSTLYNEITSKYDKNGDGLVTRDEILDVTELDLHGKGLTSISGLNYFTGLKKLNLSGNVITDVSPLANLSLEYLNLENNKITSIASWRGGTLVAAMKTAAASYDMAYYDKTTGTLTKKYSIGKGNQIQLKEAATILPDNAINYKIRKWNAQSAAYTASTEKWTDSESFIKPYQSKTLKVTVLTPKSIKLKWAVSKNADGYEIYRKAKGDKSYTKIYTAKAGVSTYTDKKVKKGVRYAYRVRPYVSAKNDQGKAYRIYAAYTPTVSRTAIVKPSKPAKITLAAAKSYVKIAWGKSTNADGYRIYRKTAGTSKYKCIKTIKSGKTLSYKDKTVKKGKKYTYRVRPYIKDAYGRVSYGSYSKAKSVKAK
ncbi:MAG: cellulase family glycosylhydrolase [Clostridium sp.]|nr:cellulase family glycosylhydrolase [Clostridium sp.]MCM1398714.1 cellulase family glycosylhydrolase [Clostridium sp.]MCM1458654.1 cellulase family glycosylhydrolase [Bacteroides sp.]